MELFDNLGLGFAVALSLQNVLYCFIGVLLGTLIGVLPGIGPIATVAMLLPLTFHLEPHATRVTARTRMRPRADARELVLAGDELKVASISIDDAPLSLSETFERHWPSDTTKV